MTTDDCIAAHRRSNEKRVTDLRFRAMRLVNDERASAQTRREARHDAEVFDSLCKNDTYHTPESLLYQMQNNREIFHDETVYTISGEHAVWAALKRLHARGFIYKSKTDRRNVYSSFPGDLFWGA